MEGNIRKQKMERYAGLLMLVIIMAAARAALAYSGQTGHDGNVNGGPGNVTVSDTSVDAADEAGGNQLLGRRVYFAGFEDSIFGEETKLELKNPQENEDFYMMYRIIDIGTDKVLFESDLIESGKALYWRPAEELAAGTWHLSIQMMPYYSPDGGTSWMPLTGTDNRVVFTVLDSAGADENQSEEAAGTVE